MASLTFRDLLKTVSPRWLQRAYGIAHKILYSWGVHVDAVGDAAIYGVRRRFPGYDSYDQMALIGRDRKVRRGISEADEVYAARCNRWLDDHLTRGNPYSMLEQLGAHYAANPFPMALVTRAGVSYYWDPATKTISRGFVPGFAPDSSPELWARWWLYFFWPDPITSTDTWGSGGVWGDGGVWGSDFTGVEIQDLRLIPTEWNAAHCTGTLTLYGSGDVWGVPPGGTWGDPGVWGSDGNSLTIGIAGGGGSPGLF